MAQDSTKPRLLPVLIDEYSRKDPNGVFALVPKNNDNIEDGFEEVTYKQLADAIDKACWWLDRILPDGMTEDRAFAYTGKNDLRYCVMLAAASKTARVIMLPGASLTPVNAYEFLQTWQCTRLLYSLDSPTMERDKKLVKDYPKIRLHQVPDLKDFFCAEIPAKPYPFQSPPAETYYKLQVMIAHTSGTTGLVKPITFTHGAFACLDIAARVREDPAFEGRTPILGNARRLYAPFSFAHAGGISMNFLLPLYSNFTIVHGPSAGLPSPDIAHHVLTKGYVDVTIMPPYLLENIYKDPNATALADLTMLYKVYAASAPLNAAIGGSLSNMVRLQTAYGLSEALCLLFHDVEVEDWDYVRFYHEEGVEMMYRGGGKFEAVILRDDKKSWKQAVFHTRPHLHAFYTKDLWAPHPRKPGLFRYAGRIDLIITLSAFPSVRIWVSPLEWALEESPIINAALIGGDGRKRPFLLVEFVRSEILSRGVSELEREWDLCMERANACVHDLPAKLSTSQLIVAYTGDFVRTAKGTVARLATFEKFSEEIEAVYEKLGDV